MPKNTKNQYIKDDEALREQGFTEGPKLVTKFELRPVTALSLSWLQRNKVFDGDFGDNMQKAAAYAFLHHADKAKIRGVVNDRREFLEAVDDWIEDNIAHHSELVPISAAMAEALETYMAATTTAALPSNGSSGGGRKN
jgi:hypothetical protein